MTGRRGILALAGALIVLTGLAPARAQDERAVLVFAAASLKNALDAAIAAYGRPVKASYAGSPALARQIEQGAPADLFFPADLDWMSHLVGKGLIAEDTRTNLLRNSIVLVAPKESPLEPVRIGPGFDLAGMLGEGRLAVADVSAVPAGKYGKAALLSLGVWDGVQDRLAQAENVRAALVLVSRGETPLGIVYRTDAAADPGVKVLGTFPATSHPPIVYPVALTREAMPAAAQFLAFLRSDAARSTFEAEGFTVIADERPS